VLLVTFGLSNILNRHSSRQRFEKMVLGLLITPEKIYPLKVSATFRGYKKQNL